MLLRSVSHTGKGWFVGPWDSNAPVALGYSDVAVDELYSHQEMYEIYLIARGTSLAVVNGEEIPLEAGDMLVIEPAERHTLRESSDDYLHFVVQTPYTPGDKTIADQLISNAQQL